MLVLFGIFSLWLGEWVSPRGLGGRAVRRLSRRWPLTWASSSGWSPRVRSACTAWSLSRVTAFSTTSWPHSTRSVSCNLAATWGKHRLSSSWEDYKEAVPPSGSRPAPHPAGKQTADTRVRNPSKYVAIRAGRAQQSLIDLVTVDSLKTTQKRHQSLSLPRSEITIVGTYPCFTVGVPHGHECTCTGSSLSRNQERPVSSFAASSGTCCFPVIKNT